MLHPTIDELTNGDYNRYELALATAKCARIITDEYVRQHEAVEKAAAAGKDSDRPAPPPVDTELKDRKAVSIAVSRIYSGEYVIDEHAGAKEPEAAADEEAVKADEE